MVNYAQPIKFQGFDVAERMYLLFRSLIYNLTKSRKCMCFIFVRKLMDIEEYGIFLCTEKVLVSLVFIFLSFSYYSIEKF